MSTGFQAAPIGSDPSQPHLTHDPLVVDDKPVVVPDTPESLVDGDLAAPPVAAPVTEPAHQAPVVKTRAWSAGRVVIAVVVALALLAAGVGIGYAMGASTRSDLASAQTLSSMQASQIATLRSQLATASATSATNATRAAACQTAMTASNELTGQWQNLWSDLDRALSTTNATTRAAIFKHMNAQYQSMMQAQGRVDTLMQTCTGTGA